MGWCDDVNSSKYNKLIRINNKKIRHEKLFRSDSKYDLLIPIQYNSISYKKGKGSAIFPHLTKDYKKTLRCIALKKEDMIADGLSAPLDNNFSITGALTFYNSPVSINNSNFYGTKSEDFLNLFRSNFAIKNTVIIPDKAEMVFASEV